MKEGFKMGGLLGWGVLLGFWDWGCSLEWEGSLLGGRGLELGGLGLYGFGGGAQGLVSPCFPLDPSHRIRCCALLSTGSSRKVRRTCVVILQDLSKPFHGSVIF